MSIHNIWRDSRFTAPLGVSVKFPAESKLIDEVKVNANPMVHIDYGSINAGNGSLITTSQGNGQAIGMYFPSHNLDRAPYRVKASYQVAGASVSGNILVGYGPASPEGVDDIVEKVLRIPFKDTFDDLLVIEPVKKGDDLANRPTFLGIEIVADNAIKSKSALATLSVQNLGVKPPTMHSTVP